MSSLPSICLLLLKLHVVDVDTDTRREKESFLPLLDRRGKHESNSDVIHTEGVVITRLFVWSEEIEVTDEKQTPFPGDCFLSSCTTS